MKSAFIGNGPVVIGGIGGSGTRVVAKILTLFGFYLGNDLNIEGDNTTYTLLFKRPAWFLKNFKNERQLTTGLRIMEKCLLTGEPLSSGEKTYVKNAAHDILKHGHNQKGDGTGAWVYKRLKYIENPCGLDTMLYQGWGWKEPNSHLLIPLMNDYFPNFRYIHTIRHGLDMAYSSNQQQLHNWGSLFGVDIPENESEVPNASFRYWVEANKRAITLGHQLGSGKFLLVNFDNLCEDPIIGVEKIAEFIQINPAHEVLQIASKLPEMPKSKGRYMTNGIGLFDEKDLAFLKEIGFSY